MNFVLENHQVHIWEANLKTVSFYSNEITQTLSGDELERANKFKFTQDREHFILRRQILRQILSKYCGCQPGELIFGYNSYKKPFIRSAVFKEIKFNMSFSDDLMIVGLCRQKEIGVDIERIQEIHDSEKIAGENFSLPELKYLHGNIEKTVAFLKIWTRKEAFIKAKGKGIYYPLNSFCTEVNSSGCYDRLVIFNHPRESKLWRTAELNTFPGYIASMAIKSDNFNISYFQLK
ncbi:MAG: 4'-phosphopantetheinyl transferase superfamily protein [Bacteroidales bacterium]